MPRINRKRIHKDIYIILLALISFGLVFSKTVTGFCTILLLLNWMIEGRFEEKAKNLFPNKLFWLFVSLFLLTVLGILYTSDLSLGLKIVERQLSFFIFPLVIFSTGITNFARKKLLILFAGSCFLALILSAIFMSQNYLQVNTLFLTLKNNHFRSVFSSYIGIHPVYFSFYTVFSCFIIIYLSYIYWRKLNKIFVSLIFLVLIIMGSLLVLLSSRMSIFISIIGFLFCLVEIGRNLKSLKKIPIFGLIILFFLATIFLVAKNELLNQRFKETMQTEWSSPVGKNFNSTTLRIAQYRCSFTLIKENWFFGYGTGDVQNHLNECYRKNKLSPILYAQNHNSHNQFLTVWLRVGVLGAILFLVSFIIPGILCLRKNYFIYIGFLVIAFLSCLTESVFEAQKGIVFYSYFNSLLAVKLWSKYDCS